MAKNDKLALLGSPVRAHIGGHMATVFLTDYEQASDSYWGEAHRNRKTGDEKTPVVESVRGLRPYPYTSRPDYAFQFVLPGEDEQPLLDIAQGNVRPGQVEQPKPQEPDAMTPGEATFPHPADKNFDGVVTKKERKQYDKENA